MWIWLMVGVLIGFFITCLCWVLTSSFGTITIDQTDLIKDMYKIEIEDLDVLETKKRVILRVKKINTQN